MQTQKKISKEVFPRIFDLTSTQCLWAQAKVVPPRPCHNAYDCSTCSYDKKIQREIAGGRLQDLEGRPAGGWSDPKRYARTGHEEHQCRHMLSGRVPINYCTNHYDCGRCPYDQMLDDVDLLQGAPEPTCHWVAGFSLANNYYYHPGHMWARVEYGGRVRVGLDDFAWRLFGAPEKFELPELGQALGQGEPSVEFNRGKHGARALSPVRGVVVAVNPRIKTRAAEAHTAPYGQDWLMVVAPDKLTPNLKQLTFGPETEKWLEGEAERLNEIVSQETLIKRVAESAAPGHLTGILVEETHHRLAATGGKVIDDVYGNFPDLNWDQLVQEFLHTGVAS
jgi:glycine cleavage system H lipoate-binding protein